MAIYKCGGRGAELWEQLQLAVRAGLEPGTSGLQVRCSNHLAALPPFKFLNCYRFYFSVTAKARKFYFHVKWSLKEGGRKTENTARESRN